ncbi:MAG: AAA family ATPase [Chloroflexi bacterium]|nr:AAA family ATPase [Chloroflexota bacterium]
MSVIKHAPNQPYVETQGKFDWEDEETLVDQRNKLGPRISRLIRSVWLWVILTVIVAAALLDADIMRGFLSVMTIVVQLLFIISITVAQFVMMFWFMARSRTYTIMPGAEGISFKDYRGQPEILEQAQQVVTLLRGVAAFEGSGGEPLNGLLLEGPPGTGKTWLAQAISTEAGVPFYYVDTSSLQGTFIGTGSMKVSQMFGKARKAAKEYGAAVIFMDEIDSVGSRSGVSTVGNNNMMGGFGGGGGDGLLNTMLVEMSGFSQEHGWRARMRTRFYKFFLRRLPPKPQKRVLTIGATNRISALDPALLRPGRFDKKLRIDAPLVDGRREIFEYYLSKMGHDDSMDPVVLATETPGYTPADIKYVLNETLRYALFAGRRYMTYNDFQMAQPEHEVGLRAPIKHLSPEAKERLAYHEAGHALAVRLFQPDHRIARVTIIRQGSAFGHVYHYPARESYEGMLTRDKMLNDLRVAVAGKAGEIEFCGLQNQTLGVGGDFSYIRWRLGLMARAGILGPLGGSLRIGVTMAGMSTSVSPEMAQAMEETFQRVLNETRKALRENQHIMRALAALLLEKEELFATDVKAFFDQYGLHTPEPTMIKDGEEFSITNPRLIEGETPAAPETQAGD